MVTEGCADAIVALEPSETLRVLRYANTSTLIFINTKPVIPSSITLGSKPYPNIEAILHECRRATKKLVILDAFSLAKKSGNPRIQNVVMLGSLAASGLPFDVEVLRRGISKSVRPEYFAANMKAFDLGREAYRRLDVDI